MKKYLLSIISLVATFGLYAEEEPFSSFGSTWLQVNGEVVDYDKSSVSSKGASAELNFGLINFKHFGMDLSIGAGASSMDLLDADYNSYTAYLALKPYVNLYKGEDFALTVFANASLGYGNNELTWTEWNGPFFENYKYTQHSLMVGLKAGVEITFAKDFYIAPALKYTRSESIDESTYGFSSDGFDSITTEEASVEIEFGYRITSWISLHLAYTYLFEFKMQGTEIDFNANEFKGGLRVTF